MDSNDYRSLVLHYGRLRFYHSMQKIALDGLAKFPMQSEFRLFNGVALALGLRLQESIRELNPLKNDYDLGLAATMTLVFAHKHCRLVDQDALHGLERRIDDSQRSISASSYYYAAVFLFLNDETNTASEYVDRCMKMDGKFDAALVLKIWCDITTSQEQGQRANGNLQATLEECIARSDGKSIDAALALVRFYQSRRQFDAAILVINKLSVRFPELNIPLIEKMETQLAALDWDHALETSMRVINMEPSNVTALRVKAMLLIVRESNLKAAAAVLQQLISAAERIEPGNHTLLLQICQLFSRICSRNPEILQITLRCMDKTNQLNPNNVDFLTELGNLQLMVGNINEAEISLRSACNVDSNNFEALCGLTLCKLRRVGDDESRQQTRQQLAFLMELNGGKREPQLLYMSALLADAEQKEMQSSVKLLTEAAERNIAKLETIPFGVDYICRLDPDFMLELSTELLRHCPVQIQLKIHNTNGDYQFGQESMPITLKHCQNILDIILQTCPGHQGAIFTRAKVEFLCGESTKAIGRLQHILNNIDETFTEAHLLLAQILLEQKQFGKAMEYLELALSHNFTVRDRPMYHLLMGIIQRHQEQLTEAHQSFLVAMQLAGATTTQVTAPPHDVRDGTASAQTPYLFTSCDKITLYLELIYTLRQMGDSQSLYESERLLQSAIEEFSGTSDEGRLVIAQAQIMLDSSNIVKAIQLLYTIGPDQSYYIQARTNLANIYLHHQKDRTAFSNCFKELVETRPEPKSYLMLGEAYMSIQEADLAVEAYRKALQMDPLNPLLASKLGRAYVKSHQYAKALKYYHDVIKNPDYSGLKLDLAELFLKLKQFQNAVDILEEDVKALKTADDVGELQLQTKKLLLLARVYEKSGNIVKSLQTLQQARDNQYRVQKLCSTDQSESLYEQYKILSKICLLMAQQSIQRRDNEQALQHFKECVKYTPNDVEILVSLARLQMNSMEMDLCRDTCLKILQIDSNNESASVMMADLSFRKMEFENAAYHFSQLLISQPCYWTALARLVEVMRRSGTLSETEPFLQRAEQACVSAQTSSGLNYCKGLYEWYNGNANAALRYFNVARRDHEWGQQAIFNMIEICINPDGDIPNGNDLLDVGDSGDFIESRAIALRTAERLLKDLRPQSGSIENEIINHRVLWNFLQMASKQKFQVESALLDLTELSQKMDNQIRVGIILAMASALVQLKQTQRAKNQLKRIARLCWNFEEAEYLERSWLLLADIYINSNKLDVAQSFVDRVLEYNKSSTKAHELAGQIAEKLQSYSVATKHYDKAWNCGGRSKPYIGYKLAFNHMKIKQYAKAINVCLQVLKLHPDYIIIRKDILEKCRNNLRS
ncbi:tetratricopeptide repeat protein 21B-like [Drosophila tropicalis]|uniref:tetratricopeptide repeat protein 21B-like n=1 Tax=Drosophila tropicalis TaxID=46794 RepID=UPI0035ABF0A3